MKIIEGKYNEAGPADSNDWIFFYDSDLVEGEFYWFRVIHNGANKIQEFIFAEVVDINESDEHPLLAGSVTRDTKRLSEIGFLSMMFDKIEELEEEVNDLWRKVL